MINLEVTHAFDSKWCAEQAEFIRRRQLSALARRLAEEPEFTDWVEEAFERSPDPFFYQVIRNSISIPTKAEFRALQAEVQSLQAKLSRAHFSQHASEQLLDVTTRALDEAHDENNILREFIHMLLLLEPGLASVIVSNELLEEDIPRSVRDLFSSALERRIPS